MTTRDQQPLDPNDTIGRLLRLAGQPQPVPAERMERARANVRAHWLEQTGKQRNRTRWVTGLAAAASLFLLVNVAYVLIGSGQPTSPVRIAQLTGPLMVDQNPAVQGDALAIGQTIFSGKTSRASLLWTSGHDLRLDHDTRVEITGVNEMKLVSGRIYIDSGAHHRGSLVIDTPLGPVRDIGTQFEVHTLGEDLVVRVREGLVEVTPRSGDSPTLSVEAGFRLDLAGGDATQKAIDTHGEDWDWAYEAAPSFDVEGRSLDEFLDWMVRQNGWTLQYGDLRIRRTAEDTLVRGSIQGLSPVEALDSILRTYGFDFLLEAGTLHIQVSANGTE